jgi:hypothetical protein
MRPPLLLLALALTVAAPALAETVQDVEGCIERNFPKDSSIQTVVMNSQDRVGSQTQFRAKIYWRKFADDGLSRVLMRLSDPPELRGAAILFLQKKGDRNDIFMWLPELGRVKRVTGHMMAGSLFGTDFSYEDFEGMQGLGREDITTELLPAAEVSGRPVHVLQAVVRAGLPEPPTYEKTVTFVDRETCVPLRVELFEKGGKMRKRLDADVAKLEGQNGHHIARRMIMSDLRDGTSTELVIEEIEFGAKIDDAMFTQRALDKFGGKTF